MAGISDLTEPLSSGPTTSLTLPQTWFLALPAGACLLFLFLLITARSLREIQFPVLSISSLLVSTYIFITPPGEVGIRTRLFLQTNSIQGPLRSYLPYTNGALVGLIAFDGRYVRSFAKADEGFWLLSLIPGGASSLGGCLRGVLIPRQLCSWLLWPQDVSSTRWTHLSSKSSSILSRAPSRAMIVLILCWLHLRHRFMLSLSIFKVSSNALVTLAKQGIVLR